MIFEPETTEEVPEEEVEALEEEIEMIADEIEGEGETSVVDPSEATVEEEVEMQDVEAEATVEDEAEMQNAVLSVTVEAESAQEEEKEEAAAVPATKKSITKIKLFVGSLPTNVSDEDFSSYWKQFDGVLESNVTKKFGSDQNKGFGFVFCSSKEIAESLIKLEGGHEIGGKKVVVEMGRQNFTENRFYIKLVDGVEEAKVKAHFESFGKIEDFFCKTDKGYGFVTLESVNDSDLDLTKADHTDIAKEVCKAGKKKRGGRRGGRGGRSRGRGRRGERRGGRGRSRGRGGFGGYGGYGGYPTMTWNQMPGFGYGYNPAMMGGYNGYNPY